MKCRYCANLTLLTRPTCTHCGEEFPPAKRRQQQRIPWQMPRHERPLDPAFERWKSMVLSAVVVAALAGGGFVTFDRWPAHEHESAPTAAPTKGVGSSAAAPAASTQ